MNALRPTSQRTASQPTRQLPPAGSRRSFSRLRCRRQWLALCFLLAVLSQVLLGCSTTSQTKVSKAANADLSQYRTFDFAQAKDPSDVRFFTPTNEARVKAAIQSELEKRGFRLATPADLDFCVYLKTTTKTYDKTAPVTGSGSFRSDIRTYYGILYDNSWGTQTVVTYPEGTLVVQAVDRKQDRMVWEGMVTGVLHRNRSPEQIEARIREAVASMFKGFPAHQPK